MDDSFPRGGDDAGQPIPPTTSTPPLGPMTRSRVKAIHAKVNSLLTSFTFDDLVNGVLPHGTTLCVISYRPLVDTQDEAQGAAKEDPEDGREEVEEEEEARNKIQAAVLPLTPAVLPPTPRQRYYRHHYRQKELLLHHSGTTATTTARRSLGSTTAVLPP